MNTPAYFIPALTDDLTSSQFQALLSWLWVNNYAVTASSVKAWRKANSLPL